MKKLVPMLTGAVALFSVTVAAWAGDAQPTDSKPVAPDVAKDSATCTLPKVVPTMTSVLSGRVAEPVAADGSILVAPLAFGKPVPGQVIENVKIATDNATAVTLDGKKAKLTDLTKGIFVRIVPAGGTAQTIAGSTRPIQP